MTADTVGQLLRERATTRGDHLLLVCDTDRLTYREAEQRSAVLARGLIALGAGKGTHIGLLYPNGSAFVVAMLAAARIGAVVVPFSTFSTERELRDQLVHSDAEILLATTSFRGHDYVARLDGMTTPWLRHVVFDNQIADTAAPELAAGIEDDVDGCDPLVIVYTSGSTGTPKGVVHTHEALVGHQRNLNAIRRLTADDRLFCNSPFFWIGGLGFGLLATLVAGATLVCSNADAGATLDLLEEVRPTMTNGFASGIQHLARHESFGDRDLSSMRRGNLYPIMAPAARPADPELRHNMLGMTEAGSVVLLSGDETDQPEHRRGSFGKPAPGFEATIVDGELCLRGRYLMQGYYKRSREECFDADGWFHTGDLFRTDDDGFFYFVGRSGSMIKTAGANVFPAEVEKAIATVTGGLVAHVLGLPDPGRGQLVAAAVLVPDGGTFDEAAVRDRLKTELSSYKIPRRFATLRPDELPLRSSGKVDLARLAAVFDA
ncbi:acyl-CoA synthetase (AMP-forming)/AMP-acid ligase II [Mycobacterium sp. BK086]|uniref:class I adenylate-forming enzyme family protein n=1 Tax=Mycobacterium sp. BK086 TaxID=2512165 RepID=UPI00105E7DD8|nr:class I adenylate-forming enzyme family protein [Mycobacterium sp. BK086]TDO14165.1 acyl-CoA synthetase (AMP-forming)/AMP-acid ligase II [Mycobacterium sp. BK086]